MREPNRRRESRNWGYTQLYGLRNTENSQPIANYSPEGEGWMETRRNSAFNQTRESFLALDVVAGDYSQASFANWILRLKSGSDAGLWMAPFRGIPDIDVSVPLDLIYLDADGRVIDLVECFPSCRVSPSTPPAASVLALPIGAIHSSQTERGDQLMVCAVEDMQRRMGQISVVAGRNYSIDGTVPDQPVQKAEIILGAGTNPSESNDHVGDVEPAKNQQTQEAIPNKQGARKTVLRMSWVVRWLFPAPPNPPEMRRAPRQPATGLVASFWTGGAPTVHTIRDISLTGLYVITSERWYIGTVVRMTLTKTEGMGRGIGSSICVRAAAVRWGNDGVGLQFVLQDTSKKRQGQRENLEGADRQQFDQFLKSLRDANQ
jgi:hypothetical protein